VINLLVGIVADWLAGKIVRGTRIASAVIYSALGAVILLRAVSLIRGRGRS
jgi:hypothetical protein